MEWTMEEINALKERFSTSIKLRRIKYYKIYGTLKKRRVKYSLILILSAIPQLIITFTFILSATS